MDQHLKNDTQTPTPYPPPTFIVLRHLTNMHVQPGIGVCTFSVRHAWNSTTVHVNIKMYRYCVNSSDRCSQPPPPPPLPYHRIYWKKVGRGCKTNGGSVESHSCIKILLITCNSKCYIMYYNKVYRLDIMEESIIIVYTQGVRLLCGHYAICLYYNDYCTVIDIYNYRDWTNIILPKHHNM